MTVNLPRPVQIDFTYEFRPSVTSTGSSPIRSRLEKWSPKSFSPEFIQDKLMMATSRRQEQFKAKLGRCHYDNRSGRVAAKEKEASAKLLASLMKKLSDALSRATEAKDDKMSKGKKMSTPKDNHARKNFDEHLENIRSQSAQRQKNAVIRVAELKAAKIAKASAVVSNFMNAKDFKKQCADAKRAVQRAKYEAALQRAHAHRQCVVSKAARLGERRWETFKEAEASELGAMRRAMESRHAAAEARASSARRDAIEKAAMMGGRRQKRVKMTIEVQSPEKLATLSEGIIGALESLPKPSPTSFAGDATWAESASRQATQKAAIEFAKMKLAEYAEEDNDAPSFGVECFSGDGKEPLLLNDASSSTESEE